MCYGSSWQRENWRKACVAREKAIGMATHPRPRFHSTGHDGPRHLHKIDGQTSRRPLIEINIKNLFLYRYFKCTRAQTHPRLLTLVDYSFFLPSTSCARFQVAVGYLLTTATAGFPENCLFFQASGHYITPRFLGRPRALVRGWGIHPGGAVASVTPNPSPGCSHPGRSIQVRED